MSTHRRLATLGAVPLLLALLLPAASATASSAITVKAGGSIQAAINRAPAGGTVVVQRGTYKGNLEIRRSVHLVGQNAVIVPAAKPTPNLCVGPLLPGVTGLCIHGKLKADGSLASAISGVSIEGFTVRDFSGPGIIVGGVNDFRASRDVITHNGFWGIDVAASSDITLVANVVYGNGSDGIHVDYAPTANAVIVGNASYGNVGAGILFLSAVGGRIAMNDLHDNCAGIIVAAVGDPTQSGAGDVSVELNQVAANNRLCPAVPNQAPAYGGVGIALVGTKDTIVELNDVRDNVEQTGSGITGGGIVLLDGAVFGATAPTGNSIRLNRLSGNTPNDIYGDSTGTGNTISGNTCTKTNLTGAC
jgi:nitrous oxidase accessory protein NosD